MAGERTTELLNRTPSLESDAQHIQSLLEARIAALQVSVQALATIDLSSIPDPVATDTDHVLPLTDEADEALGRLIANNAMTPEEKAMIRTSQKTQNADEFANIAPWLSASRINEELRSMEKPRNKPSNVSKGSARGESAAVGDGYYEGGDDESGFLYHDSARQAREAKEKIDAVVVANPKVRAIPEHVRADLSITAGKKNPVAHSMAKLKVKDEDRATLPLGTWTVDAYIGGAASGSRFGHEYYLRFVCKATGKRRTYG